jgi:hypothetical protein
MSFISHNAHGYGGHNRGAKRIGLPNCVWQSLEGQRSAAVTAA